MLRLVFGLGTRAVDRVVCYYPRIVCLDDPNRKPLVDYQNVRKFSQHYVDLLDLEHNTWTHKGTDQILNMNLKADKKLFASKDFETMRRLRERGDYRNFYIVDFPHLLQKTDFPQKMREILKSVSYTHLDVYKRQIHRFDRSACAEYMPWLPEGYPLSDTLIVDYNYRMSVLTLYFDMASGSYFHAVGRSRDDLCDNYP